MVKEDFSVKSIKNRLKLEQRRSMKTGFVALYHYDFSVLGSIAEKGCFLFVMKDIVNVVIEILLWY